MNTIIELFFYPVKTNLDYNFVSIGFYTILGSLILLATTELLRR